MIRRSRMLLTRRKPTWLFNSANSNTANISYSGGGRTLTCNDSNGGLVVGTPPVQSGKWYAEVEVLALPAAGKADLQIGVTQFPAIGTGVVISGVALNGSGDVNGSLALVPDLVAGDVVGLAYDRTAGLLSIAVNNVYIGAFAVGWDYLAVSLGEAGQQVTIRNTLSYDPPAGYGVL